MESLEPGGLRRGAGCCCGRSAVSGVINASNSRKSIPAPASSSPLEKAGRKPINFCLGGSLKEILGRSCTHCWIWKGLGSLCAHSEEDPPEFGTAQIPPLRSFLEASWRLKEKQNHPVIKVRGGMNLQREGTTGISSFIPSGQWHR